MYKGDSVLLCNLLSTDCERSKSTCKREGVCTKHGGRILILVTLHNWTDLTLSAFVCLVCTASLHCHSSIVHKSQVALWQHQL